jgi:hypothetical protein
MRLQSIFFALLGLTFIFIFAWLWWYSVPAVHVVTKDERRAMVSTELDKALERYYDEHGRYPTATSNDALIQELSAKAYFANNVRIDVVRYVPINNGQTYELQ